MSSLEERWHSLIQGSGRPIHALLRLASWGYGSGVAARNALYDHKLLPTHSSPLPTISVGNLLLGGSGKTPLVRFLAQSLEGKVAILSRGYKSRAEKRSSPTLVLPDSRWEEVGDEPLMLARSLPDALVIVCADRLKGAAFAKKHGAQVLLLDDGFQYRRLARDVNIVCIPATTSIHSLSLFPRGPLREPLSALKRALRAATPDP